MGRRKSHEHWILETYDSNVEEDGRWERGPHKRHRYVCGDTAPADTKWGYTLKPDRIGCLECGAKYWAAKLAETDLTLERIELAGGRRVSYSDPAHPYTRFDTDTRSILRVMRGGQHVAWVYLVPGFGKGWQMSRHAIRRQMDVARATVADVVPGYHFLEKGFRFRDQAAVWLAEQIAAKSDEAHIEDLVAPESYLATQKSWAEKRARRRAEMDAESEERRRQEAERQKQEAAAREEALGQLRDLAAREDLTNYQRAGLVWAFTELGITMEEADGQ